MVIGRAKTEAMLAASADWLRGWGWSAAGRAVAGDPARPAVFSLLFGIIVSAATATWAVNPGGAWRGAGWWPFVATTAILVAVWQALPWDPRASRRRKLIAPAFLAAALTYVHVAFFMWGLALYPIAVANAVFLFGFGRGSVFAVAALPLFWASVYLVDPAGIGVADAAFLTGITAPMAVFMVGICKVVLDAERSRREVQALLGDLEAANAELRRQAGQAKALAVAEERARLAREVHDSLGHHLTAINLQLHNAERFAAHDPERSLRKVREARASAQVALAEVRRAVRALNPPTLDQQGSVDAISALARSFDAAGPEVSFRSEGVERPLPAGAALALYRAAQEGLTNAARHANARRVAVALAFAPDAVTLTVVDDGTGAPDDARDRGFGLSALRERVEALGGAVAARNRAAGGFALEVVLPLDAGGPAGAGA